MDLSTYQGHALSTALPTALTPDYLIPGLVAEVGELFGKRAKAVRDGWSAERLQSESISELGDVCWFTAVFLHLEGVDSVLVSRNSQTIRPFRDLIVITADLYDFHHRGRFGQVRAEAKWLWGFLQMNCESITGESFEYVLAANVAKLSSRRERGALQGSGDNR